MTWRLETWGTGPPLLLLHGFLGGPSSWDHLRKALGKRRRCFAVELPGHGASPAPRRTGTPGFEDVVSGLVGLLAAVGRGRPIDVVGYSQGARLALAAALASPSCVRRLVLESGTAGISRAEGRRSRQRQERRWAARLKRDGTKRFAAWWEARPMFSTQRRILSPEARRALEARRRGHRAGPLAASILSLGVGSQPSLWWRLPRLRRPTLVITGSEDLRFTETGAQLVEGLPWAWHARVPRVGHAPHLEAPVRWACEVVGFLGSPNGDGRSET